MATIQTIVNEASDIITMETVHNKYMTEYIWVMNTLSYWIGQSLTGTKGYETNNPLLALAAPSSNMPARRRVRDLLDATRDHISIMSGRYRISSADFDKFYELYQEDTSAKGLYEFIVDHHITHSIAGRLNLRPIDVLAAMVCKTADTCQEELEAEKKLYQAAAERAAARAKKAKGDGGLNAEKKGNLKNDNGSNEKR
ncbi:hypothetical protein F5B19DRAFT_464745 [Rostrohypoxylon terebratum]|nr:hypothetical protein F5B19DRAFT_464745 [Rostrohypoxylon terebratum]